MIGSGSIFNSLKKRFDALCLWVHQKTSFLSGYRTVALSAIISLLSGLQTNYHLTRGAAVVIPVLIIILKRADQLVNKDVS